MPSTTLRQVVEHSLVNGSRTVQYVASPEGNQLIEIVAAHFSVSRDAARVRLLQHHFLSDSSAAATLF